MTYPRSFTVFRFDSRSSGIFGFSDNLFDFFLNPTCRRHNMHVSNIGVHKHCTHNSKPRCIHAILIAYTRSQGVQIQVFRKVYVPKLHPHARDRQQAPIKERKRNRQVVLQPYNLKNRKNAVISRVNTPCKS